VSPVTSNTLEDLQDSFNFDKKLSRAFHAGRLFLCRSIDLLQQKEVAGVVFSGGMDQKTLRALGRLLIEFVLVLSIDVIFFDNEDEECAPKDSLSINFGTEMVDNGRQGKSSRLCNMFCASPYISNNIGSPNGRVDRSFAIFTWNETPTGRSHFPRKSIRVGKTEGYIPGEKVK